MAGVREIENLWIPLPDGGRLAARMWLPEGADTQPVPAIVEYLPYRKRDLMSVSDDRLYPWYAARGYACLRIDLRGSGESAGVLTDEYLPIEQDDMVAALAWIGAQDWCTGKVGMMGISWSGFNALQVAARRPLELAAIVAVAATDDRFRDDVHAMGGWPILNDNVYWGASFLLDMCLPPDPALVGEDWHAMWRERCEAAEPPVGIWLKHPNRDAYWRQGSVAVAPGDIACPTMVVAGFADGYQNAAFRLMETLEVPRRALIGPWVHAWPHHSAVGPRIGFLEETLAWWDRWLKGKENGVEAEPPVQVFVQESQRAVPRADERAGRFVALPSWPAPGIQSRALVLNDGSLDARAKKPVTRTVASPPTTGLCAGDWSPFGGGAELAADQRSDDAGSLCFDGAVLKRAFDIVGAPGLALRVAVDRPAAFVVARLLDVHPDGHSTLLSVGVLNLAHRDGDDHAARIVPGETMDVTIALNHCARRVLPGHRLRLALSTAWWPMLWPAPQPVTATVTTGESVLRLPVMAASAAVRGARPPAPPSPGAPTAQITRREGERGRTALHRDYGAGTTTLVSRRGGGLTENPAIDLLYGVDGEDRFTVSDDGRRTEAVATRSALFERAGWKVEVAVTTTLVWQDGAFTLEASLTGRENGAVVIERAWAERFAYG